MREFKQIDVRAIDLEALGVQIAYVMTDSPARKDVCRRNARLIAAGEDLLEALVRVNSLFTVGIDPRLDDALSSARAAISKATGAA